MSLFSERLKNLREERNIYSKDLAHTLNVEPATVTNWEKGNRFPREDMLIKIADFFDCTTDYLLGRTDNRSSIIYFGELNNKPVEIEVDKDYPYDLTPQDVENILNQLDSVGLNVEKLIETSRASNSIKNK